MHPPHRAGFTLRTLSALWQQGSGAATPQQNNSPGSTQALGCPLRVEGRGMTMQHSMGVLMFCWQQGRGQAASQKHGQQSQAQGKSKKQKLAELDETPPKPWKPLNATEIAEGQRSVTNCSINHAALLTWCSPPACWNEHCSTDSPETLEAGCECIPVCR